MKLIRMCDKCAKEFELFPSSDGLLTNEKCPHCGYSNSVWLKIMVEQSDNQ